MLDLCLVTEEEIAGSLSILRFNLLWTMDGCIVGPGVVRGCANIT